MINKIQIEPLEFVKNGLKVIKEKEAEYSKAASQMPTFNLNYILDDSFSWAFLYELPIQEGTPQHILQELGGWSSPEMVQKYAHLSSVHLMEWVDRRPALAKVAEVVRL